MVPCDLCSGTGFWRALASNDANQKYQGVVCPECEGAGTLRCPVCLGTGDGNVKGLLRRRRVEPGPGRILQTNVFPEDGEK
jgi:DnaJ-class molecular chaperone